jgi:hypothetical protein
LTSAGRSICTQWPAPSMNTLPRMSVTHSSIRLTQLPAPKEITGSFFPAMKKEVRSIFAVSSCGVSSMLRSMFRYHVPEIVAEILLSRHPSDSPPTVRHAHADDRAHALRMQESRMPGDRRAPVVANNDELFMTERIRQSDDVISQIDDVVGFNLRWTVAAAVATLIRRGDLEPGFNKRINLMSPEIPALREAVQENDQRAFAFDY